MKTPDATIVVFADIWNPLNARSFAAELQTLCCARPLSEHLFLITEEDWWDCSDLVEHLVDEQTDLVVVWKTEPINPDTDALTSELGSRKECMEAIGRDIYSCKKCLLLRADPADKSDRRRFRTFMRRNFESRSRGDLLFEVYAGPWDQVIEYAREEASIVDIVKAELISKLGVEHSGHFWGGIHPENNLLQSKISACDVQSVQRILGRSPDVAEEWTTSIPKPMICHAAEEGNAAILRAMINAGNSINEHNEFRWNPLLWALTNKSVPASERRDMVELLVSHGADVNCISIDDFTPLNSAIASGDGFLVRLLLDAGARMSLGHICTAVRLCDAQTIQYMITCGCDTILSNDECKQKLLAFAQQHGDPEVLGVIERAIAKDFVTEAVNKPTHRTFDSRADASTKGR